MLEGFLNGICFIFPYWGYIVCTLPCSFLLQSVHPDCCCDVCFRISKVRETQQPDTIPLQCASGPAHYIRNLYCLLLQSKKQKFQNFGGEMQERKSGKLVLPPTADMLSSNRSGCLSCWGGQWISQYVFFLFAGPLLPVLRFLILHLTSESEILQFITFL